MQCCGEERLTRFCPECGQELGSAGLRTLLDHLKRNLNPLVERAVRWRQALEEDPGDNPERFRRRLERVEKRRDKWQSWVNAVEQAIRDSS
jgi:hypothetical protein